MNIGQIKTMVKQHRHRTKVKASPSYRYGKHWASYDTDIAFVKFRLCPSPLEKSLKIGGIVIQ